MSASTSAAELKTQGVIEAANDPNTSVTADDAQKKLVTESRKAGVAAFTFNPDASPEEKAAQARAVSLPVQCAISRQILIIFPISMFPKDSIMSTNRRPLQLQQM